MTKPRDLEFSARFKRLRLQARIRSQRELARLIQRDPQTVHEWEKGKVPVRMEDLQALADVFHTTVPQLLSDEADGRELRPVHPDLVKFFQSDRGAALSARQKIGLQIALEEADALEEHEILAALVLLRMVDRK